MAAMIVKHRVANFDQWKKAFDSMEPIRLQHGWTGHDLFRDATDPNVVVVVNHVKDLAGAKAYGGSPELHAAMAKGGVQGTPEIQFFNDVA